MDIKKLIKSKIVSTLAVLALVSGSIFTLSVSSDRCNCIDCECCAGCSDNGSCDCGICRCCDNCNATSKAACTTCDDGTECDCDAESCCPGCTQ